MNSKSVVTFLALLLMVGGLVGRANACPSANGPVGLWNVPSAQAMLQDTYNLFVNYHSTDNELSRFGANIGTGLETPLEIGVTSYDRAVGRSQTVFSLK